MNQFNDILRGYSSHLAVNTTDSLVQLDRLRQEIEAAQSISDVILDPYLSAAVRYPEKVVKVIVVGSLIQGTSLSLLLKTAGYQGWIGLAETALFLFRMFRHGYAYLLARDGKALGNMMLAGISNLTVGLFFESIGTLHETDLRPRLGEIRMPVLGVYGKRT